MEWMERLGKFNEMKAGIRGSSDTLIVGVDVAKDKHYAFFGTSTGVTVRKCLIFENNKPGFQKLLDLTQDFVYQHDFQHIVFGVEPTGVYHKPLAEYLMGLGEVVVLVSSVAAKRNRQTVNGRWDKNDKSCAANVADLISQGKFLYYDLQNDTLRELSCWIRQRAWLRKQKHRVRLRLRNYLLAQYFPELDEHSSAPSLVLSVLDFCPTPEGIALSDFAEFRSAVLIGKNRTQRQEERIRAIWHAAKDSVGCPMPEAAQQEAALVVSHLRQLHDELAHTEAQIARVAVALPEYQSALSIPGFGPIVSATTVAAIGAPCRFRNRLQVLRLAGLDLSASRSGKSSATAIPRISKQGKAELRYLLVQAATVASAHSPVIRRYFSRQLEGRQHEPGIKRKMRVKLAAKLLVVAWTLMKNGEVFDPKHFPDR